MQEQALAAHIPHQIVRCSLQMYGSFRYVSYCNVVVAAYYPRSGVVAGCAHATTYVQVYGGPHYESFCTRHLACSLAVYNDDVVLGTVADTEAQVIDTIMPAAQDLLEVVEVSMKCSVSEAKADLVASHDTLGRELRRKFNVLKGRGMRTAVNLGIDIAAGRPRAKWITKSKRQERLKKTTN